MKKDIKKDNNKNNKSILICKILTGVSVCLSLLSLLFGCASLSSKTNNNDNVIPVTNQNNLIIPNFDNSLSDPLNVFKVNSDSYSEIKLNNLFEDPYNNQQKYLVPLFDNLSRYLSVYQTYSFNGSMRLVKYFSDTYERYERGFYVTDIKLTMNEEYDLYYADLTIVEEESQIEGVWHIPSWNFEETYIECGPFRWEYPFYSNFLWSINYSVLDYSILPFYTWTLPYSGVAYHVSLSRNFNYNLLLQEPTLDNLISFSRTPFVNALDYNLPLDYFNVNGGYFDIYIGNFSSNGYSFDTIRTYYESASGISFYTPSSNSLTSDIITGTVGDFYVSKIAYFHSKANFELLAFKRASELAFTDSAGISYEKVIAMNLQHSYLGSYDLTLYTRSGFDNYQEYIYILTFINLLSEGNATSGGVVSGGNSFDNFFQLIYDVFASLTPLLGISIFGTFTLGTFVFIPLVLSFIMIIIKLFKR